MSSEDLFERDILSVSQLTGRLKDLLEIHFGQIWLVGEISNFRLPSSGHAYLTLKDATAQIRAVMFRTKHRYLGFEPADGQEVLVRGRLSVYEARGDYQLLIDYMEPRGEGALRLAFEKLKSRLAEEGLFDEGRKRKIPFLPGQVAVVTSPSGAAIRDFIRVSRRRFENVAISIYPVRVQGAGAAEEIVTALSDLNRWGGFDLIVLTRGGGSLEDLWAFNEEQVARAIAASVIPVVTAVGHEVDFSIADYVADLRAPTPSAAAELIFREKNDLKAHLSRGVRRMLAGFRNRNALARERLEHLNTRLGDPRRALGDKRLYLDDLTETLIDRMRRLIGDWRYSLKAEQARLAPANPRLRLKADRARLETITRDLHRVSQTLMRGRRERLGQLAGRLSDLSPWSVLKRGYALVRTDPEKVLVRSSDQVTRGQGLRVLLEKGELGVSVEEVIE